MYEVKPGMFDGKRDIAALLIKHSGLYFIFNPKQENKELVLGKQAWWKSHLLS